MLKKGYLAITLILLFTACTQLDVFEKTTFFPKHEWSSAVKPSFNFTIKDTAARYNVFVVIRHNDAYHFNNLWVNLTTIPPGDTAQTLRLKLILGDNTKWLGSSMDDIIEHRIRVNANPVKFKAGDHQFFLQQIMREDPLQNILNAGIRIEKIEE